MRNKRKLIFALLFTSVLAGAVFFYGCGKNDPAAGTVTIVGATQ